MKQEQEMTDRCQKILNDTWKEFIEAVESGENKNLVASVDVAICAEGITRDQSFFFLGYIWHMRTSLEADAKTKSIILPN